MEFRRAGGEFDREERRRLQECESLFDQDYDPFHKKCGEDVFFSDKRLVATRRCHSTVVSWGKGMVFSAKPIPLGGMFQVKLLEKDRGWPGSLAIGFTLQDPDTIDRVPMSNFELRKSKGYWLYSDNTVYHDGRKLSISAYSLKKGNSIGCCITRGGDLEIYINERRAVGWRNVPVDKPLWGVVDMYGYGVTIQSEFYCEPGKGKEERTAQEDSLHTEVERALEKGAVDVKILKCMTLGPPEAGKTQLKHALLGKFAPIKKSTDASTQATPAVEIMVTGRQKWEPLDFKWLQSAMQTTATKEDLPQRPAYEDTQLVSQIHTQVSIQENMPGDRISADFDPAHIYSPSYKDDPSHKDDPLERKISTHPSQATYINHFRMLKEKVMEPILCSRSSDANINIHGAKLIYTVDSGGQPSFLDFHPVTATFAATYLLVYNMEEGLDAKPKMTYRKDYPTIDLPNSSQSNLEIVRRSLFTLHHFKERYREKHERLTSLMPDNFKPPRDDPYIIVVGTRRNEATLKEDKKKLKSEYMRIPSVKEVMKIHFVDSLKRDSKEIDVLRSLVCTDASSCSFRLPLSWFQLHLMCLASESRSVPESIPGNLTFSELRTFCLEEELVSSHNEFKAMVTVFHSLGVFSCPDLDLKEKEVDDSEILVFINPGLLFANVTKILEIPFRVFDNQSLINLQRSGELTTKALEDLGIPNTLGSYQGFHKRLLKWLVHWGLAAEMEQKGKWFIPSVLPPKPIIFHTYINENPFSPFPLSISFLQESSHDFTFHYLPEGFFPHFVVKLKKAGYFLSINDPDHLEAEIPRCRDAIFIIRRKQTFNAKITFNISLIDEATHLSVHMYPADRSAPNARQEAGAVLAELKHKMEETNESLYHRTNDPIAICCPCPCSSKEGRIRDQHIARVDPGEDGSIGITCLHPRRPQMGEWEERSTDELLNEVISGFHSKSDSSPSESDLLKVLDIVPEWYNLAVALGVPVERVKQFQQIKTGGFEALCYWRCGESGQKYPTTWSFLLAKIEECQGHIVAQDVKKVFFPDSLTTDLKTSSSSSDPVTSSSEAHPFDVSEQLCESFPDPQCGAIIEMYKDRFLSYINARAIVTRLEIEEVIPDTVSHKIQQSAPSVANEVLFLHLRSHSSLETLHKLCDVMIGMSGYPKMNELGRLIKDALTTV